MRALVETPEAAAALVEELRHLDPDLAMVRCPATPPVLAQTLEGAGFHLMDTLVYFEGRALAPQVPSRVAVRPLRAEDLEALTTVARLAFTGFAGHYHADPRIDSTQATDGYVDWFTSQCTDPNVLVLVATADQRPAGFLTLRLDAGEQSAEIVLNAVDPAEQGRGIYDALVKAALRSAAEHGKSRVVVSTQVHNLAPQKVWVRNGFEPFGAFYTFHRWTTRSLR